ncbi:antigen-presenting glycoprotein CD1d-like [Mantella aurantiaca]
MVIPSTALYLHLFLGVTATDIRVKFIQTYVFSSEQGVTLWGSLYVEDIQILAVYNDTRLITFKQSWAKGNLSNTDWMFFDMFLSSYIYYFQIHIDEISKKLRLQGAFTIQCMVICPSFTEYPTGYAFKVAIDGEDLVYFNVPGGVWIAGNYPQSKTVQEWLQRDQVTVVSIEQMLKNQCHSLAATYSTAGEEEFSRKRQPQVYITAKPDKSEQEIICWVTGFYPKPINVSLWKENKMAAAMSSETLPNGDGTYQLTVLTITEQQDVYCRVEHSSLKEPMKVHLGA